MKAIESEGWGKKEQGEVAGRKKTRGEQGTVADRTLFCVCVFEDRQ